MRSEKGYTIIELLAVVTILIIVTSIIAALITQTLRGGSKSSITNQVAQVGNYTVSAISNTVISAENIVAVDGVQISDCIDNPTGRSVELLVSISRGIVRYACENETISSNSASLIDTNRLKVDTSDPTACYFTCRQANNDPYTPPVIEFGFTLTQKSGTALFESRSEAPFKTSVLMRNYKPR